MLQVVQYQKDGSMLVEEFPSPSCIEGGILVKTYFSLISAGTEKASVDNAKGSLFDRARKQPDQVKLVLDTIKKEGLLNTIKRVQNKLDSYKSLGYSAAGIVVESDCSEFSPGDRVACAGAGYANHAEMISVPKNLAVKLPDNVSFEDAAYTTLGAIAMQGFRQAEPVLGETIAVIGLGLLGQITVQLLKSAGCRVIGLDINESLFEKARSFGADKTMLSSSENKDSILAFTRGMGCDSVIITASAKSNQPIELAMDICRKKGKVVVVGDVWMNIARGAFYLKEIDLRISCSYGPGRYDANYEQRGNDYPYAYVRWTENRNMQAFIDLISSGRMDVKSMTTHVVDIKDAVRAYDIIGGKIQEKYLGILLKYNPENVDTKKNIKVNTYTAASKIKLGFIGAGGFASNYLLPPLKKSEVDFVAVSTATAVNAKQAARTFGFAEASTDSESIIRNKDTNCIFIASRHDSHAEFVRLSIENNKPVFVEKPLAINFEQLESIKSAVEKYSGRVMVGFNRRFSDSFKSIAEFFKNRSEPLAMTYRVNAGFIPKSHWVHEENQGGRIIGEVCHFIDTMVFLCGALPIKVSAECISSDNIEVNNNDNVIISLKFADGSIGNISYLANGDSSLPKEYCEVFCERSSAIMDNFTSVSLYRKSKKKILKFDGRKGINEEVEATINSIKNASSMPIPFDQLYATSRACLLAVESLKTGNAYEI